MAASEGQRIAEKIRAELVCCDIYERATPWRAHREENWRDNPELVAIADEMRRHQICYWGEAAARIAEGEVPHE